MTLSILIPVYRYDCTRLVTDLLEQCIALSLSLEIILGDDASGQDYASIYDRLAAQHAEVWVYHAPKNIGAGLMRQELATKAKGFSLLYTDADVLPTEGLIATYMKVRAEHPDAVVCGGFRYDERDCRADNRLRYHYGTQVEMRSLAQRIAEPYKSFIAMCFLAPRELVLSHPFPRMGMGYEDTYWGEMLRRSQLDVVHIDAPVVHRLKETDEAFLSTTERYLRNLHEHRDTFEGMSIKLLGYYRGLRRYHLARTIGRVAQPLMYIIRQILRRRPDRITLFQLYKLLYFCSLDLAQSSRWVEPNKAMDKS